MAKMKIAVMFDVDVKNSDIDPMNIRQKFGQYLYYMLDIDIGEDEEFIINTFQVERALSEA